MGFLGELRDAIEVVQKADNVELYRQLLDIQAEAQELYEEKLELKEGLREAQGEIERLKERLEIEGNLVPDGNFYFLENSDGDRDGPFCTRCWDVDDDLVRLRKGEYFHRCPNCALKSGN